MNCCIEILSVRISDSAVLRRTPDGRPESAQAINHHQMSAAFFIRILCAIPTRAGGGRFGW